MIMATAPHNNKKYPIGYADERDSYSYLIAIATDLER